MKLACSVDVERHCAELKASLISFKTIGFECNDYPSVQSAFGVEVQRRKANSEIVSRSQRKTPKAESVIAIWCLTQCIYHAFSWTSWSLV